MEAFVWDARYVTGEPTIDAQHQELVRIINWVADYASSSADAAMLQETMSKLVQYALMHFRQEESFMAVEGFDPRYIEKHKSIHREFADQVAKMRRTLCGQDDIRHLLRFLTSWLSYHILGIDQGMVRQSERIRAGMSPEEAYRMEQDIRLDPATSTLLEALSSLYSVVAERNQSLTQLTGHLEQLVEERTEALSSANERLQKEQARLQEAMATIEATQQQLLDYEHQQAEAKQSQLQSLLAQIIDGDPVPTLVIDADHRIAHWNKACALVTGLPAAEMIGTSRQWQPFYAKERPIMADLIVSGAKPADVERYYGSKCSPSALIEGAIVAEDFFSHLGEGGRWFLFTAAPLFDARGQVVGAIETLQDVTERRRAEEELRQHQMHLEQLIEERTAQLGEANRQLAEDIRRRQAAETELLRRYEELEQLNRKLSEAQEQLIQSDKLASIGQLAAGVAHEINNPIGYVQSNIGALEKYLDDLFRILDAYEGAEGGLGAEQRSALQALRQEVDLGFLKEDIPMLMRESKEGITRVKKIVQDLKDFSHVDNSQIWQWADLHQGIDSTINIVYNEIKYRADVVKEYGTLPEVECLPSQLNQVFMNLLVNAAHAMREPRGRITVRTGADGDHVWLEFVDDGIGIPPEIRQKIFDPFFTTKPVGKGTGLGLALAYGIVKKHNGRIDVESEVGKGTTFRITLPIKHVEAPSENTGKNP